MADSISRRALAKALAAGAASAAVARVAPAQATTQDDYARLQTLLAKPLPESLEKIAREALAQTFDATNARSRFKLPDCSEPCTVFIPQEPKRK